MPPEAWIARAIVPGDRRGRAAGRHLLLRLLEQPRARLGRAEDDRAAAEDPRRDGALQRSGVGGERHARGDVGGHHPVLGDRDEQQVEEEALVLGRLAAGEQQVEVLGEAQPAHQVAGEVAPPHLDPVGIGLADVADRGPGLSFAAAIRGSIIGASASKAARLFEQLLGRAGGRQQAGDVPLVERVEDLVGLADDGDLLQRVRADDHVGLLA